MTEHDPNQQNSKKPAITVIKDGCPTWAHEVFIKIQALEIRLGNVRETAAEWQSVQYDELVKRAEVDEEFSHADTEMVEEFFSRTCRTLVEQGFSPAQIAEFANSRIGAGGKLKYCSAEEVSESIN